MSNLSGRIAIRLDEEELARVHALMRRRGIVKISDFVRQCIANELERQATKDRLDEFAIARIAEDLKTGRRTARTLGDVVDYPTAAAEQPAPYGEPPAKPKN